MSFPTRYVMREEGGLMIRLMKKAEENSCTTGKSTIGDEKTWNVFMRLDTPEAK